MSIRTDKSFNKARAMGAWAGIDYSEWQALVELSKRELIEMVLRLAASAAGECDDYKTGVDRAAEEYHALRNNGII